MEQTDSSAAIESLPFEQHAERVLARFRSALARVIESLPGDTHRAQELSRALGIDKTLSWRIANLVRVADPFEAAQHVPGTAGMRIFLRAAKKKNVPTELINATQHAVREFDQLVEIHATDRTSLEMMLSSRARKGRERVDLEHRRAAFRANSYLWGIQARAQLKTHILHPSATNDTLFDVASVLGFVGLRRIRADVPWVVYRAKIADDDGIQRRVATREPIDGDSDQTADSVRAPLLRDFCTHPLPQLRRVISPTGTVEFEIAEGEVGNTGAITCMLGEIARNAGPRFREEHNRFVELVASVMTPCESLVFDQIVHRDLVDMANAELAIYGALDGNTPPMTMDCHRFRLPVFEEVEPLGHGLNVLHTSAVPQYVDLIRHVLQRVGWREDDFTAYRAKLTFPPLSTSIVVRGELRSRPAD
jgi:hypothetical protein